ncbi:hypothetical protein BLNAU_24792 [Blattamonas nauphoetae]|uniref:Uncharacterized protein n=1 Tax=Blattamonas nauphoetae TaxID=2049346 RepID=A0ABQ9WPB0_9EUKA|nr:hypothetical protein BLNAU_24792 [Blattamonas nauphoetae]
MERPEPTRIKSISPKLNREKSEVIVELAGVKFFSSPELFIHMKNTNTGRAFSSTQSEDDTHLQFGLDYLVTSIASVDGLSSFLFSEGLEVTVPSAPIVDTISSSLSPSGTTFQRFSPAVTMTVNFVDRVGTTPWLSDGVDEMQLNTTYTIIDLANDNDVILVNQKTFTTTQGPTLLSIDTPTLKSDNLNVIVLTLNGERIPLKATHKLAGREKQLPTLFHFEVLDGVFCARMTSTTVPVSIPSTVSFTTPAAPTRIILALVVDSDVTFKVPAEPSRLISVGSATYSNQDREVSVSLSGVKLSGTYWIVLESNTSTANVNVSVSFSESGIGELKGILYSKALPLSMNMTYDTVYKIVGMEDSSQKPIFFESGLTFFTMKEPARIEDGKCQLNPVRDKLIVTLTGRVLSPGGYSVVLTHSEASKSRTITGSVNSEGNVECSHSVDTNEADSLVFGETYSITSAHRDGSPIHVTSGLTLQIPRPPKVTEAIVHPNILSTAVTIELLGTDLDIQGTTPSLSSMDHLSRF